jgi:hypothetical protein
MMVYKENERLGHTNPEITGDERRCAGKVYVPVSLVGCRFYCLFISILPLEIQRVWDGIPLTGLTMPHLSVSNQGMKLNRQLS